MLLDGEKINFQSNPCPLKRTLWDSSPGSAMVGDSDFSENTLKASDKGLQRIVPANKGI